MNVNKKNTPIDDALLTRFLVGEATLDEKERVSGWLEESEQNSAYFESFATIWLQSTTDEKKHPDADAAWQIFEPRMRKPVYKILLPYLGAVAAILLIVFFLFPPQKSGKTTFTAANQRQKENLPDGTEVTLSPHARLSYFFDHQSNTRTARLAGKAFFHVKRDTVHPFVVKTPYGQVEVLGTQFNVNVVKSEGVYVNVLSGVVRLTKPGVNSITLRNGESGFIPADDYRIRETQQDPSEFFNIDKTLIFNNVPLSKVFSNLEQCYAVAIHIDGGVNTHLRFTSQFKDNSLNEILNVISQTYGLKYEETNHAYYISLTREN
jgi:transmembrane sensor